MSRSSVAAAALASAIVGFGGLAVAARADAASCPNAGNYAYLSPITSHTTNIGGQGYCSNSGILNATGILVKNTGSTVYYSTSFPSNSGNYIPSSGTEWQAGPINNGPSDSYHAQYNFASTQGGSVVYWGRTGANVFLNP